MLRRLETDTAARELGDIVSHASRTKPQQCSRHFSYFTYFGIFSPFFKRRLTFFINFPQR